MQGTMTYCTLAQLLNEVSIEWSTLHCAALHCSSLPCIANSRELAPYWVLCLPTACAWNFGPDQPESRGSRNTLQRHFLRTGNPAPCWERPGVQTGKTTLWHSHFASGKFRKCLHRVTIDYDFLQTKSMLYQDFGVELPEANLFVLTSHHEQTVSSFQRWNFLFVKRQNGSIRKHWAFVPIKHSWERIERGNSVGCQQPRHWRMAQRPKF